MLESSSPLPPDDVVPADRVRLLHPLPSLIDSSPDDDDDGIGLRIEHGGGDDDVDDEVSDDDERIRR